eukprot:TRINITY_DN1595_c0_g1_i2.p1 TRINITY_DN1595_c0_g1~~TRINITY_DN1595_c0_g1_i2.p1  ORF type:complete len:372 (+),score=65.88 TRINITY_DN1595_c0_g1_i2:172-1287(+)
MARTASLFSARRLGALAALIALSIGCSASERATCCDGSVVSCPRGYVATKQLDLITGRAVSGIVSVARLGSDITVSLNTTSCFVAESVSMWLSYQPLPVNGKGGVAVSKFPYKYSVSGQTTFSAVFSTESLIPAATGCADGVTFAFSAQTKCVCSNEIDCGGASGEQSAWVYGAQSLAGIPWESLTYCCGSDESEVRHNLKARGEHEGTTGEEGGTTGDYVDDGTTGESLEQLTTGDAIAVGTTGEGSSTGAPSATTGLAAAGLPKPPAPWGTPDYTWINVQWAPDATSSKRKRTTGLTVTLQMSEPDNNAFVSVYSGPAEAFHFNATGLESDSPFYWRVYVSNAFGDSPFSDETLLRTLKPGMGFLRMTC